MIRFVDVPSRDDPKAVPPRELQAAAVSPEPVPAAKPAATKRGRPRKDAKAPAAE